MNGKESISNEQLAYLNDNLDLVSKYVNIKHVGNVEVSEDNPFTFSYAAVNLYFTWHNQDVIVYANVGGLHSRYQGRYYWRELLQFVEDHDNAPPIFK